MKRNYGGKGSARVLEANTGVVVCTIEKANSLINRMSEERCLSSLSCVVVDELHMVRSLFACQTFLVVINKNTQDKKSTHVRMVEAHVVVEVHMVELLILCVHLGDNEELF